MEFPKVTVELRTKKGKGTARRLRQHGKAPAVLYGSHVNAVSLAVPPRELKHALAGPLRTNTVLSLTIENATGDIPKECSAIVRDHQYDPVTRELLHVDFLAVELGKPIAVKIPLELTGKCIGLAMGGNLSIARRVLPVDCVPEKIPAAIFADITDLNIDDKLAVSALTLPEGISINMSPNATLIHVEPPRAVVEEATTEEEGEGEGAEGEAAPAAPAAE